MCLTYWVSQCLPHFIVWYFCPEYISWWIISIVCFRLKTRTLTKTQDGLCLTCNTSLICSGCFPQSSVGDKLFLVSVLLGLMEILTTGTFSSCEASPCSFPFTAQIIKSPGICLENGVASGLQKFEVNLIKCRYLQCKFLCLCWWSGLWRDKGGTLQHFLLNSA